MKILHKEALLFWKEDLFAVVVRVLVWLDYPVDYTPNVSLSKVSRATESYGCQTHNVG